jgi:hypothetical protein
MDHQKGANKTFTTLTMELIMVSCPNSAKEAVALLSETSLEI